MISVPPHLIERTVHWPIQPFQQRIAFIASVSKKQGLFPDPSVHEINRGVPAVILLQCKHISTDDDRWNTIEGQIQIGHMDASSVHICRLHH